MRTSNKISSELVVPEDAPLVNIPVGLNVDVQCVKFPLKTLGFVKSSWFTASTVSFKGVGTLTGANPVHGSKLVISTTPCEVNTDPANKPKTLFGHTAKTELGSCGVLAFSVRNGACSIFGMHTLGTAGIEYQFGVRVPDSLLLTLNL